MVWRKPNQHATRPLLVSPGEFGILTATRGVAQSGSAPGLGPGSRWFESSRPELTYHIYVLESGKTQRRYVGSTEDVERRVREHNAGKSKSTRAGVPWQLLYSEAFGTRSDAVRREMYFKTGRGREELD